MPDYQFVIVSAEVAGRTFLDNAARTRDAMHMADAIGVAYQPVSGAYKGVAERSIALSGNGALEAAMHIGATFGQESILVVCDHSNALLLKTDGEVLAVFTQRIAATADNYTEIAGERFSFAE